MSGPPDATPPEVDTAALVAAVPAEAVAKIDPVRLAPGVVPPSNRWYSGLVFGDQPQPVFAEPLSFGLTDSGFTLGLPTPDGGREGDHRAARAGRDRGRRAQPPPRSALRTR